MLPNKTIEVPSPERVAEAVNSVKTIIDKICSEGGGGVGRGDVFRALDDLESLVGFVTKKLLLESKIGVALNRVAKATTNPEIDDELRGRASAIVGELKKLVVVSKGRDSAETGVVEGKDGQRLTEYLGPPVEDFRTMKAINLLLQAYDTGESGGDKRNMKPEMLGKVLYEVALELEGELELGSKEYQNQLRSLKSNLADKKNPDFRWALYTGEIEPKRVPVLKPLDMASRKKKAEREQERSNAREACQSDWAKRHSKRKDGQFQCRKCRSWQTEYFQAQTRSADEPMTTYVTCNNCANRWKF